MRTTLSLALAMLLASITTSAQAQSLQTGHDWSQQSVMALLNLEQPQDDADAGTDMPLADEDDDENGIALRLGVGFNSLANVNVRDYSDFSIISTGVGASFNTGLDLNIGLDIPVADNLSIEVMTGLAYNSISSIYGTVFVSGAGTAFLTGGTGDLYQMPIVANFRYDINLNDNMSLGLHAGLGTQYNSLTINTVTVTGAGGTAVGFLAQTYTAWSFRYQFGADLAWDLTNATSLGIYCRFSGSTEAAFAYDFTAESLYNLAVGGALRIEF